MRERQQGLRDSVASLRGYANLSDAASRLVGFCVVTSLQSAQSVRLELFGLVLRSWSWSEACEAVQGRAEADVPMWKRLLHPLHLFDPSYRASRQTQIEAQRNRVGILGYM